MKMLRFSVAAMLLFGPFSTYASSAAPKVPPQERPKTPASKAAAVAQEEASPEEKTRRRDWNDSVHAQKTGAEERVLHGHLSRYRVEGSAMRAHAKTFPWCPGVEHGPSSWEMPTTSRQEHRRDSYPRRSDTSKT